MDHQGNIGKSRNLERMVIAMSLEEGTVSSKGMYLERSGVGLS